MHELHMAEMRHAYKNLVGKPDGSGHFKEYSF
jgi:hypothetical protein